MVALVIDRSLDLSGSILTSTVASELELNGISPPPDMVEEEIFNSMYPSSSLLVGEPSQAKVNSKPDIT